MRRKSLLSFFNHFIIKTIVQTFIFYLVQKLPELSCVSFWLLDESTFSVSSSLAAYYMVIRWKAVVDPIKTFYKSLSTYL